MNTLEAANDYLNKGFSVIPLQEKGKKPAIPWKEYQTRKPTTEELFQWFDNDSKHNIGIVTGKISNLAVVDFDSEAAIGIAQKNGLPPTPLAKTARGYHAYFKYAEGVRNFQKRDDLPEIDFRGDGGCIVAPPSIHTTGTHYAWVEGKSLDDLPLAELPDWVLAKKPEHKIPLKELYQGVTEGNRNNALARLVGSWINNGLTVEDCLENAAMWNLKNKPPLTEEEIEKTVNSIFEKHQKALLANPAEEQKQNSSNATQAQKLLDIASSLTLFHDQHKKEHVFLDGETIPLSSNKIKQWLSHQLYLQEKTAPNSDAKNQAIAVLEGKARYDSPEIELHNRIANKDNAFWYDMGKGKAVKITENGWELVDAPILFSRYSHQQPQVTPIKDGDPWRVFEFLNVDKKHQLLVLVYIISCFVPDIPHPIFHPHGTQGAGKTTLCKIIKKLCDPSSIETIITPRDANQLIQLITHHHVCIFDNLSGITSWMSDILAQACTGGGFSKRQLYSDDNDIVYQLKRCIGLNGINLLISKSDLMDRSILLPLERIAPAHRREESILWKQFDNAKPEIIGGIFDVLAKAKSIYPSVNLTSLPRMADFNKWGFAISQALGVDGNEFIKAYQNNIAKQTEEIIQGNTLAQAVLIFMGEKPSWDGTIKEAWQELNNIASPDKTDNTFPRNTRNLRNHLERIKANLIDHNIFYKIGEKGREGYPISFQKGADFGSLGSPSSQTLKI